jgi:hypothetical protein
VRFKGMQLFGGGPHVVQDDRLGIRSVNAQESATR